MTAGDNRAVVIDTMVVSALMNSAHDPTAARYLSLIASRLILVSFVTVTEMRYGALKARWGDLRRRGLERDLARFVFVVPDDALMHACADLRATTERAGHPLGQKIHEADRWIAATAMKLGVELVSDDAVFRDVPGLTVITNPD